MIFEIESKTYGKCEVIVDDEDEQLMQSLRWCVSKKNEKFYVVNRKSGKYLHDFLIKKEKGQRIDHIDGNPLNNKKSNLRACSHKENICNAGKKKNNTTGYKGVYLHKPSGRWFAQLKHNYKTKKLGYYETKEDAARAYNRGALKYYGVFAFLNEVTPCL